MLLVTTLSKHWLDEDMQGCKVCNSALLGPATRALTAPLLRMTCVLCDMLMLGVHLDTSDLGAWCMCDDTPSHRTGSS